MIIKTCENSSKIDSYEMKYCYIYIIKSIYNFTIQKKNIKIISYYNYDKNYYLILWTDTNNVNLEFLSYKEPIYITKFLVKTKDTYVFSENKTFTNINQIIKQQYLDLSYKIYNIKQIMSSVWLNILTSNKLLYYQYFIDLGFIQNTKINLLSLNQINNYSDEYIIKGPYSSTSFCIKTNKPIRKECFINEGVIISKINYSLKYFEIKIHTFQGKILYADVRNDDITKDTMLSLNKSLEYIIIPEYKKLTLDYIDKTTSIISKYKKEINIFCLKIYNLMNELILIMKYKLNYELEKYIKPLKLQKYIFYSFFTNLKINKLKQLIKKLKDENKIKLYNEYINFIKLKPQEIKKMFKIKIKPEDYLDYYMRIDLMFPDDKNYKEIGLLEIEPFACGKGIALPFLLNDLNSLYKADSNHSSVFIRCIYEAIKNNVNMDWEKISKIN